MRAKNYGIRKKNGIRKKKAYLITTNALNIVDTYCLQIVTITLVLYVNFNFVLTIFKILTKLFFGCWGNSKFSQNSG